MSNIYSCKLKQLRKNKGLTQREMAKMLGYKGRSGYCQLENGDVAMTIDKAKKISQLLDVDLDDIFFNKDVHVKQTRYSGQTA